MKATASILLYSGMKNPEKELTEQQSIELRAIVDGLVKPSDKAFSSKLGFSGFGIHWDDMFVAINKNVVSIFTIDSNTDYQDFGIENKLRAIFADEIALYGV